MGHDERQWLLANPVAAAAFLVLAAVLVGVVAAAGPWQTAIVPVAVLALLAGGRLRTTLEGRELVLRYFPVWRRRVPLAEIVEARAHDYRWFAFGGWGIRYTRGTWAYTVHGRRAVLLRLRGKDLIVGTQRPDDLLRALAAAGVRVGASGPTSGAPA